MGKIFKIPYDEFPLGLQEIPHPPKALYHCGTMPSSSMIYLAIVGSRDHTHYGSEMCEKLIKGLKGYPIVIVSGLAIGIDTIAHATALKYGIQTVAIPGSGLADDVLYPRRNVSLAKKIIESGGCLLSEFEPHTKPALYTFPQRNRLMAGLCKAVLVIEAKERSGTLITARMALDYNRDVLTVPGSVLSVHSHGTNTLLRQGATPITTSADIIEALGLTPTKETLYEACGNEERRILEALKTPHSQKELINMVSIPEERIRKLLSILEIKGLIKETYGKLQRC